MSPTSFSAYLDLFRRRWRTILVVFLVVVGTAAAVTLTQKARYQGLSQVLLEQQTLADQLTGTSTTVPQVDRARAAATNAEVARSPEVIRNVIETSDSPLSVEDFTDESSVTANADADILAFTVRAADRGTAQRLANTYADVFTEYRRTLDTAPIREAQRDLARRIGQLDEEPNASESLRADLEGKAQELRTLLALQTSNASVVRRAENAEQVQPRVARNGVLALMLAVLLALGAAFLREAVDRRIRTVDQLESFMPVPLLARLQSPDRPGATPAALSQPTDAASEQYRVLRMNLDAVSSQRGAELIMITSASAGEGKSTTVANLSVVAARAGRPVVAVDLDLRRPTLHRQFDVPRVPGATDVMLGRTSLGDALRTVELPSESLGAASGRLSLLTAGTPVRDVGELIASEQMTALLLSLRQMDCLVLIDTPPILAVGDPIALGRQADGVALLATVGRVTRPMLADVVRLAETAGLPLVGFAAGGAENDPSTAYGDYSYANT